MSTPDTNDLMREALLESLSQTDLVDGRPEERRRRVARALVDQAIAGNVAAIRAVCDRIDGPAVVPEKRPEPVRRVVLRWLGDEDVSRGGII